MPLYDYIEKCKRKDGRVVCWISLEKRTAYRYRIVYCNANNLSLEDIKGKVIHHKDGNPSNDDLSNLELLDHLNHSRKHPDRARGKRDTEVKEKLSVIQKRLWLSGKYKNRHINYRLGPRNITPEIINRIVLLREQKISWADIANKLGIKKTTVRRAYCYAKTGKCRSQ